jgi:4-hydroxy-tetrahydrodipicolinate synthase
VVANVEPERTVAMVEAALDDEYARARELHHELGPLCRQLFVETNPIPVKEAMEIRGHCSGELRPPLTRLTEENAAELRRLLEALDETREDALAATGAQ